MRESSREGEQERNKALTFIENRINAASSETQELVTQTLVEEQGSRRAVFMRLVRELADSPEVFHADPHMLAVEKMVARDKNARTRVPEHIGHEVARRDASAMRPDVNRPSPLEWFFLTIPGIDIPSARTDWKRLCETSENIPKGGNGILTLQSVLQNVLSDEPRTKAFVLETNERVQHLAEKLQRPLNVYDIGCGPFPVLAIAAAIASPESRITCFERNPLSAEIARFIVEQLGFKNITIITADALAPESIRQAEQSQIDLLVSETFGAALFDEPAHQIFKTYSSLLSKEGETIPTKAKVSATIVPLNRGVSSRDGKRVEAYPTMVLNVDGTYFPYIPEKEWHPVQGGDISLKNPNTMKLEGELTLPKGVPLKAFNSNYCVCLCMELDLGGRTLSRYASFPTFPIMLDFISLPESIMRSNPDPSRLKVRFSYELGSDSTILKGPRYTVEQME